MGLNLVKAKVRPSATQRTAEGCRETRRKAINGVSRMLNYIAKAKSDEICERALHRTDNIQVGAWSRLSSTLAKAVNKVCNVLLDLEPEEIVQDHKKRNRGCATVNFEVSGWTGFLTPNCAPANVMSEDLINLTAEVVRLPGQRCPLSPGTDTNGTGPLCSWCCCGLLNRTLVIAFMVTLACGVVMGNSVTLTVFLRIRQFRTPQGYLKVSLALADVMVGLLVVPFSVYTEAALLLSGTPPIWYQGYSATGGGRPWQPCNLVGLVFAGCTFVSISTIFFLTVERSVAILKPLHKDSVITRRRTFLLIFCSWVAAFLLALAPLLFSDEFALEYNECSRMCNFAFVPKAPHRSRWNILLLFPAFDFTLLGATLVVNLLSFSSIRRYSKKRKFLAEADNFPGSLRPSFSDIKAAKTIAILTVVFAVSFSPIAAFVVGNVIGYRWCNFSFFAFWILAANSCCNVVIYSVRDHRFRKGLHQLFHKHLHALPDKN
uniref:trace amine-associated receptor 13c-like n=1 Tax=Pristiophorus japonicus TaxID=55135 RepID=UPI00398E6779